MDLKLQRDCGVMLRSFALSEPTGNAEIPKGSAIHCQTSSAIFLLSYSILLLSLCTIKEFVSSDLENGIVSSETIREKINWNKQLD